MSTADSQATDVDAGHRPGKSAGPSLLGQIWRWLRWPAALAILFYLVRVNVYDNWDQLRPLFERGLGWPMLSLAVAVYAATLLMIYYRWFLLTWAQGLDFDYFEAVRIGFVGMLFNFVAPGSVGGDVVKGAMIAQRQRSRHLVAAATVVVDRMIGMLGMFIVGAVAYSLLPASYHTGALAWIGYFFNVAALVGTLGLVGALIPGITTSDWVLAIREWRFVGRFLQGTLNALRLYQERWRVVVACLGISLISHTMLVSSIFLLSKSLGAGASVPGFRSQVVVGCASNFGAAFVPVPGGVGALEAAMAGGFEIVDNARVATELPSDGPVADAVQNDLDARQWEAALVALGRDDSKRTTFAETHGVPEDVLQPALADLAIAPNRIDSALESGWVVDGETVLTAAVVRDAFRVGHGILAFRTGLLTGLVYRILTVLVAMIGGVLYFVDREKIDEVIEEAEHAAEAKHDPAASSANTAVAATDAAAADDAVETDARPV